MEKRFCTDKNELCRKISSLGEWYHLTVKALPFVNELFVGKPEGQY
jgi:hypothetical protein